VDTVFGLNIGNFLIDYDEAELGQNGGATVPSYRQLFVSIASMFAASAAVAADTSAGAEWAWARNLMTGGQTARCYGTGADQDGNLYVCGAVAGRHIVDGHTVLSRGDYDVVLAKLDPSGQVQWIRTIGGSGQDLGVDISVAGDGTTTVVGKFTGAVAFGDDISLKGHAERDLFVASFNPDGVTRWAQWIGEDGPVRLRGVGHDDSGGVYVLTEEWLEFGDGSPVKAAVVHARNSTNGASRWTETVLVGETVHAGAMAVDGRGHVYVTGSWRGTADFYGADVVSGGVLDLYVAHVSPRGEGQWIATAAGVEDEDVRSGIAGRAIALGQSGDVIVTGVINGPVRFGDFGGMVAESIGESDAFVASVRRNGTWAWVRPFGGDGRDEGIGVAVGPNGDIHSIGVFDQAAAETSVRGRHRMAQVVYVARIDARGGEPSVMQFSSPRTGRNDVFCRGIVVDQAGRVTINGWFRERLVLGEHELIGRNDDVFIARVGSANAGRHGFSRTRDGGPESTDTEAAEVMENSAGVAQAASSTSSGKEPSEPAAAPVTAPKAADLKKSVPARSKTKGSPASSTKAGGKSAGKKRGK